MARRGRPEFRVTPALRHRVAVAAGAGTAHEEIALALGISRTTLSKHFEHELSVGAYRKRMEVLEALHRAAKDGNVAAGKAYIAMTPAAATPPGPVEEVLGKKAKAQADAGSAHLADPEWAALLHKPTRPQ